MLSKALLVYHWIKEMANLVSCKMDSKTIVTLALLLALSFVNGVPTVEEYLQQRNRTFQVKFQYYLATAMAWLSL